MEATDWRARGTEVRSRRAHLKNAIKAGEVDLAGLLDGAAPEGLETVALEMRVDALLGAVSGVGWETMRRVCAAAAVRPEQRLSELTIRRRRAIADALRKETT